VRCHDVGVRLEVPQRHGVDEHQLTVDASRRSVGAISYSTRRYAS
jgi:hypothetical protein